MGAQEINQYFNELKNELSARKGEPVSFSTLDSFPLAKDQALYVLDFKSKQVSFQKGVFEMLGYTPEEFSFDKVTSYYHPSDYDIISRLLRATIDYAVENPTGALDVASFVTGRIQHKNGSYIKTLRQSTVFERDKAGRMLSNISIVSDLSFIDTSDKVHWKFVATGLDEKKFREYITREYRGFFSVRELEVLQLMVKGLTSSSIADRLHISKHTVDGHRRKMLEKSHTKNTLELIHFSQLNGIL